MAQGGAGGFIPETPGEKGTRGRHGVRAIDVPAVAATPTAPGAAAAVDDPDASLALKNLEAKRKKKRRARNVKIGVAAAVAVVAVAAWLAHGMLGSAGGDAAEGDAYISQTDFVSRGDFTESVQGSGSLKAGASVVVTPEIDGIIDQVMVSEGQQVNQGDTLFTLRNADLDKAVDDASQQLGSAGNEVYAAQVEVGNLQSSYDAAKQAHDAQVAQAAADEAAAREAGETARQETYNAAVAAIPEDATEEEREELVKQAEEAGQQAYDRAYAAVPITPVEPFDDASYVGQIEGARAQVATAQNAYNAQQRVYDQAVEVAGKKTVVAPCSGTVLALSAVSGAAVGGASGGTSMATGSLATIADLSKMKVNVEVNEIDISKVAEGQRARVTFSAVPGLELEGRVVHIAAVATGSGEGGGMGGMGGGSVATFTVEVVIDQPDARLKPGMTASVNILTQDVSDTLLVSTMALVEEGDATYVAVVVDSETKETEMRPVQVKARSSSQAAIEGQVKEGDEVLLGATFASGGSVGEAASAEAASAEAAEGTLG